MNAQYQYLVLMGLHTAIAFMVGVEAERIAGRWRARRERVKSDE